jgi:5-methylcytosine-specific restriction endonuclease McrA
MNTTPELDKKDKSLIVSKSRQVWMWSSRKRNALARGRISRGIYRCYYCKGLFGPKQIDVDHVIPAAPVWGILTWDDVITFIKNLLTCPDENLVTACKTCHVKKTTDENAARREYKKSKKKSAKKKQTKRRGRK